MLPSWSTPHCSPCATTVYSAIPMAFLRFDMKRPVATRVPLNVWLGPALHPYHRHSARRLPYCDGIALSSSGPSKGSARCLLVLHACCCQLAPPKHREGIWRICRVG